MALTSSAATQNRKRTYRNFVINIEVALLACNTTTRQDVLKDGLVGIILLVVRECEGEVESRLRVRLEDDVVFLPAANVEVVDRVRQLRKHI